MSLLGPPAGDIEQVEWYLLLANDYRLDVFGDDIWVATWSSPGNVQDGSNQAFLHLRMVGKASGSVTAIASISWGQLK